LREEGGAPPGATTFAPLGSWGEALPPDTKGRRRGVEGKGRGGGGRWGGALRCRVLRGGERKGVRHRKQLGRESVGAAEEE